MRGTYGVLTCVGLLLAGCSGGSVPSQPPSILRIHTQAGPVVLHVDVAETAAEHATGLSGRAHLGAGDGMAFVFTRPTRAFFWMKDTRIPLSIAFWDARGLIVDMLDMTPCTGDPCHRYRPSASYVGAVEANLGFFARHGVRIGDRVELEQRAYA